MNDYRNSKAGGEDRSAKALLSRTVARPARTDGVGEALRKAFVPGGAGEGADPFGPLLRELDRRG